MQAYYAEEVSSIPNLSPFFVATRNLLKLTPLRWWPKIWMLTGLYEFEDCTSFAWSKNDVSVEANIAAEIMALLNIPFGAGSSVTNSRGRYTRETFPGKSVWAAEYQLVDAKFCRVQSNEMDKPATSLQLPLRLKAIYSRGTRGEETKRKEPDNMAVLCLTDEVSSEQGDTFESEDVFWEQFAKVEQTWEKRGHDIGE
ncbi:hypothetical protein HZ326_30291 [Fusarium oxysporum f. sp. albedinis]|nr:hypothetical protein HZ326_30291 [Fusarium oxysporum f. sp. albedinis]